uniref:Uncharacterized protein n=1 Tax=Arundo donax TaxID=35708 RepID=A0A0A9D6T4_ARUDO
MAGATEGGEQSVNPNPRVRATSSCANLESSLERKKQLKVPEVHPHHQFRQGLTGTTTVLRTKAAAATCGDAALGAVAEGKREEAQSSGRWRG